MISLIGRKIEVICGASLGFRGEALKVESGVLTLRDEDEKVSFIAVKRITAVNEVVHPNTRPGFIV